MKKGISPFISLILVMAISVAGMVMALRVGQPLLEKMEDLSQFFEAKETMVRLGSAMKEISYESNGSSREVSLVSRGGNFRVSASEDTVTYEMESEYELFSPGMSKRDGDIYVNFYENKTLKLILNSTNIDIINDDRWAKGSYDVLVKNTGFSGGKTRAEIQVV